MEVFTKLNQTLRLSPGSASLPGHPFSLCILASPALLLYPLCFSHQSFLEPCGPTSGLILSHLILLRSHSGSRPPTQCCYCLPKPCFTASTCCGSPGPVQSVSIYWAIYSRSSSPAPRPLIISRPTKHLPHRSSSVNLTQLRIEQLASRQTLPLGTVKNARQNTSLLSYQKIADAADTNGTKIPEGRTQGSGPICSSPRDTADYRHRGEAEQSVALRSWRDFRGYKHVVSFPVRYLPKSKDGRGSTLKS